MWYQFKGGRELTWISIDKQLHQPYLLELYKDKQSIAASSDHAISGSRFQIGCKHEQSM